MMARRGQEAWVPSPELRLNGSQSGTGLGGGAGRKELGKQSPSGFLLPQTGATAYLLCNEFLPLKSLHLCIYVFFYVFIYLFLFGC